MKALLVSFLFSSLLMSVSVSSATAITPGTLLSCASRQYRVEVTNYYEREKSMHEIIDSNMQRCGLTRNDLSYSAYPTNLNGMNPHIRYSIRFTLNNVSKVNRFMCLLRTSEFDKPVRNPRRYQLADLIRCSR